MNAEVRKQLVEVSRQIGAADQRAKQAMGDLLGVLNMRTPEKIAEINVDRVEALTKELCEQVATLKRLLQEQRELTLAR